MFKEFLWYNGIFHFTSQTTRFCDFCDVCGDKYNEADADGITMLSDKTKHTWKSLKAPVPGIINGPTPLDTFVIYCVLIMCWFGYPGSRSIHATEPAEIFP